eukprot:5707320-Amphidinium_carterae.2
MQAVLLQADDVVPVPSDSQRETVTESRIRDGVPELHQELAQRAKRFTSTSYGCPMFACLFRLRLGTAASKRWTVPHGTPDMAYVSKETMDIIPPSIRAHISHDGMHLSIARDIDMLDVCVLPLLG